MSGLGPSLKNSDYLANTMLDRQYGAANTAKYLRGTPLESFRLDRLGFRHNGADYPLLRPRYYNVPHLTTFAVQEILERSGHTTDTYDTTNLWAESAQDPPPTGDYRAALLSTSFIWTERDLRHAVRWITETYPGIPIILGGQYSNLKYASLMRMIPEIDYIVRGDGEEALPALLDILENGGSPEAVPNLVYRHRRELLGYRLSPFHYLDLDAYPSPMPKGKWRVIPYESMRGCPFSCKFCSFPAASPKWRYKSAEKIAGDWRRYAEESGASYISAMDSTFTVPPTRLRELLRLLPDVGIGWEAYSRANVLKTPELIDAIAATHCQFLSIGFESMSESTLRHMNKKVTRKDNLRAFRLLNEGGLGYRCSFMAGYPGETPEDFSETRDFLAEEYAGHFMLSVFSISDETMPLWEDKEALQIEVHDPDDPDYSWSHIGMDVHTARGLNHTTLDLVRRVNDRAVLRLWQADYQHLLMPQLGRWENIAVEKAVERIGMAPRDFPDAAEAVPYIRRQLDALARYKVTVHSDANAFTDRPLFHF
ncbi:radical SAM protein [Streptomyces sp. NPDC093982]|uniref:B12-binding domain-containing radical SAM protein n=1 Tax=Streptomyces sp. NPDC093982 TaxID=3155077 RepID=UPI00342F7E5E